MLRGLGDDLIGVVKGNHDEYVSNGRETIGFNPLAAAAVEWTRKQLGPEDMEWLQKLEYELVLGNSDARFQIVHGTLDMPQNWGYIFDRFSAESSLQYQKFPVCFVGHTHVPLAFEKTDMMTAGGFYESISIEKNRKYLINVGSVGQPRDGNNKAAFAVYSTDEAKVALYRVEYNIKATSDKIIAAELPSRLAERLFMGR